MIKMEYFTKMIQMVFGQMSIKPPIFFLIWLDDFLNLEQLTDIRKKSNVSSINIININPLKLTELYHKFFFKFWT